MQRQNISQAQLAAAADKLKSIAAYHIIPRLLAYADLGAAPWALA